MLATDSQIREIHQFLDQIGVNDPADPKDDYSFAVSQARSFYEAQGLPLPDVDDVVA
jgi:hypothetical protein